eukprot:CAMPEP_0114665382 /NCGR_PEP_ID=MMETSP0191-20121206/30637_1 /TAXON_ID=126664 /ORGANISM="Sorites sp." /LENGTH=94 /DNA_ID=CAMNT_0001910239 /DNA_START=594 /DNA_END=875 /DNA_ORIENTATION=+
MATKGRNPGIGIEGDGQALVQLGYKALVQLGYKAPAPLFHDDGGPLCDARHEPLRDARAAHHDGRTLSPVRRLQENNPLDRPLGIRRGPRWAPW